MLDINLSLKKTSIRGLSTAWIEAGEHGNPVVFLCHGFPDSPEIWRHQIAALAANFHVIAPYVRGCEESESAISLRRYSREAVLLDHLEILKNVSDSNVPVLCVGHDLGVVHAMAMARSLGKRCIGLFCINGLDVEMFARRLKNPAQLLRSWYMGLMQLPILPEMMAQLVPQTSLTLSRLLAGGKLPESHEVTKFAQRAINSLNQYRAFAREITANSAAEKRLECPVLVIWGRDDGVLLPPSEDEWRLVCLRPQLRIVPGGHWLQRDEAPVISRFLESFVHECVRQNKGEYHA
jgi:pimeloyl-ACP methyl ester carboxylesterase